MSCEIIILFIVCRPRGLKQLCETRNVYTFKVRILQKYVCPKAGGSCSAKQAEHALMHVCYRCTVTQNTSQLNNCS